MALGVVGMLLFTQLTPTSIYGTGVLPGLLVIGVGMGCIFAPTFSAATLGVAPNEAGIASAMVNTSQQVGGSIGTSLLSTIYASAVVKYLTSHPRVPGLAVAAQALAHGVDVVNSDMQNFAHFKENLAAVQRSAEIFARA